MFPHNQRRGIARPALVIATIAFASIVLPAITLSSALASTIGVSIQLLEIKQNQQADPRARASIVDIAEPGASIERRIQVTNASDTANDVNVYTTGASIVSGAFTADDNQNDLALWTTASRSTVSLGPSESTELTITINVPLDAAPGEQYAAIWAEVQSPPDPATNIINANRAGLRVYLLVGGINAAAADYSIDSLTAGRSNEGIPSIEANVTNTGGRALELEGTLTLAAGPGNLSAGPIELDPPTNLAPGESGVVTFILDASLPDGPWDATVSLTGSMVTHESTATISFDGEIVPERGLLAMLLAIWVTYWLWITLGAITLIGLISWLGVRRRKNRKKLGGSRHRSSPREHRKRRGNSNANRNERVHSQESERAESDPPQDD